MFPHFQPPSYRSFRSFRPPPFPGRGGTSSMMPPPFGYPWMGPSSRPSFVPPVPMGYPRPPPFNFNDMPRPYPPFPPARRRYSSWPRAPHSSVSSYYPNDDDSDDDDDYDYSSHSSSGYGSQRNSRFAYSRRPSYGRHSRGRIYDKRYDDYDWYDDDSDSDYDDGYSVPHYYGY